MSFVRGTVVHIASTASAVSRSVSITCGLLRRSVVPSVVSHPSSKLQPGSNQLQFVRHATKKAASSRTNDYNSKGKRLGLKKAEGSEVKTGQIIFRQRGTKWFPGENANIGRDHTIFAVEPGFVRYYRDPFHPERSLIGVALYPDMRLPTSHWQPRLRRFGRLPISDTVEADKQRTRISRKEYYGWLKKEEHMAERMAGKRKE
ncbi:ribosomal L27 protein-domain-containing protein [Lipomyces tetrasporus]|uniref:Large ribosomal subunit protein bL27m n=1 Tax=Lipomyces tetrasporus TaxID=54092 RepID=A0AAD7QRH4_9ASCO|nr:ribosomal L27 protein-domain-containing protein [Lipomyces tetrasporus]KAJ8099963.1 ribosomal L27 protein-domain-containing protein [Lipomyces tetrasporus]